MVYSVKVVLTFSWFNCSLSFQLSDYSFLSVILEELSGWSCSGRTWVLRWEWRCTSLSHVFDHFDLLLFEIMSPGHSSLKILTESLLWVNITWEKGLTINFVFSHSNDWVVKFIGALNWRLGQVFLLFICLLVFEFLFFSLFFFLSFSNLNDFLFENFPSYLRNLFLLDHFDLVELIFIQFNFSSFTQSLLAHCLRHFCHIIPSVVYLDNILNVVKSIEKLDLVFRFWNPVV